MEQLLDDHARIFSTCVTLKAHEPIFGDIGIVQRVTRQNRLKNLYDLLHSYLVLDAADRVLLAYYFIAF